MEWLAVFGFQAGVCIAQRLSGMTNIAVFFVAILVVVGLLVSTTS